MSENLTTHAESLFNTIVHWPHEECKPSHGQVKVYLC
jgi:hypothetical protein